MSGMEARELHSEPMEGGERAVHATSGERLPMTLAAAESEALVEEGRSALAAQWRRLTRVVTFVAVLTSPALYVFFHQSQGWGVGWSILATFLAVVVFRGFLDVGIRRFIPWPALFGQEDAKRLEEDVVNRRRVWYWRKKVRLLVWIAAVITIVWFVRLFTEDPGDRSWVDAARSIPEALGFFVSSGLWIYVIIFPLFLIRFQFTRLQDGTAVLVLDDPRLAPLEPAESDDPGAGDQPAQ